MIGLIGKKMGMTQVYKEDGTLCPATVLEVGPCPVVQVKTRDGKDGYNALKLGFRESDKVAKPQRGICEKKNLPPMKVLHEFRSDKVGEYADGDELKADLFSVGEKVLVSGITKGRGFTGVVKRHKFSGGDDTHGCRSQRVPGSIGAASDPSRVFKGRPLPGHYGAKRHSVKGLEVLSVDADKNVIFVKGAVPGARNGLVFVSKLD